MGRSHETWLWLGALAACLLPGCGMVAHVTGEDANRAVREQGLPAQATVLSVSDAGVRVNDDPVVVLELEVRAPDRAPWRATARQLVSILAIPAVQPGSVLAVRYDPADPSRVAVETGPREQPVPVLPAGPVEIGAEVTVERIAEGVWLHASLHDVAPWGPVPANGIVVVQGDEAALVDTPWTDRQTAALLTWLATAGRVHVSTVVVTHAHEDCLGGLDAAHRAGARSYGLERTAELARRDGKAAPEVTFTDRLKLSVGGRPLELRHPGPGHTEDNIVAWVPDVGVLFGGCLVRSGTAESLGNTAEADLVRWPDTIRVLQEVYPEAAVVVPGHGRPGGRELLQHTLDLLAAGPPGR